MGQTLSVQERILEGMRKKTEETQPKVTLKMIVAPVSPSQSTNRVGPRCESVHGGAHYRRKGVKIALARLCHLYSD